MDDIPIPLEELLLKIWTTPPKTRITTGKNAKCSDSLPCPQSRELGF